MSVKIDRMRFQANNISFNLGMIGFISYVVYVIATQDIIPKDLPLGVEIMINLFFFMILFLGLEKAKTYHINWCITLIILGGITILRVFWHPMVLLKMEATDYALVSGVAIVISGVFIALSGIIGFIKSSILHNYLKKTGLTLTGSKQNSGAKKNDK